MGYASQLPHMTSLTLQAPHALCPRAHTEEDGVPLFAKCVFPNKARALVADVSDVKYIECQSDRGGTKNATSPKGRNP